MAAPDDELQAILDGRPLKWQLGGTAGYTMGHVARWSVIEGHGHKTVAYVRDAEHAHLISAAPTLYAALEALVKASDGHAYSIKERRDALAVLAKARAG